VFCTTCFRSCAGGGVAGKQRVGQRLRQVGQQPVVLVAGQVLDVDGKNVGQRQQHRRGDVALVVFELVEIGGRDAELRRERLLGQAAFGADHADLASGEDFACAHICNFAVCYLIFY
jgi:hypothetical protein